MKKLLVISLLVFTIVNAKAQIFTAKETLVTFYSKSPLEDIDAANKGAVIVLNSVTNNIQVALSVQNFKFKNALMEEHFNENYMETEKYPKAIFKGKINETIDYTKDGDYKVTVTGKMDMHGVTRDETYEGTLKKTGNVISITTKFKIKVADYKIKVPSLYVKNIAEIVDIDVKSTLELYVKK
jgi:polyisoprenoid-binding protein YceI